MQGDDVRAGERGVKVVVAAGEACVRAVGDGDES
jgi:hypothetical protein